MVSDVSTCSATGFLRPIKSIDFVALDCDARIHYRRIEPRFGDGDNIIVSIVVSEDKFVYFMEVFSRFQGLCVQMKHFKLFAAASMMLLLFLLSHFSRAV